MRDQPGQSPEVAVKPLAQAPFDTQLAECRKVVMTRRTPSFEIKCKLAKDDGGRANHVEQSIAIEADIADDIMESACNLIHTLADNDSH